MSTEARTVLDLVRAGRVRVANRERPQRSEPTPPPPPPVPAPEPAPAPTVAAQPQPKPEPEPAPRRPAGQLDPLLARVVAGMVPAPVEPRASSSEPVTDTAVEPEPQPQPVVAASSWWRPLLLVAGVATAGVLAVRWSSSRGVGAAPAATSGDGWGGESDVYDVPTVTV